MSVVPLAEPDVLRNGGIWAEDSDGRSRASAQVSAERLLPVLAATIVLAVDCGVVLTSFLLAYWARFVVPDDGASALGIEQYLRMGLFVGVGTIAIFAVHQFYDLDRPRPLPARVQLIVSAVSTALVLAVTTSVFLGDERFSRLWFAAGWTFAIIGLSVWRSVTQTVYMAARQTLAPTDRVLIVGANQLGQQLSRELSDGYRVVGYVDNGSDLSIDTDLPLLGPIAQLDKFVQEYAIDEIMVALPSNRREQTMRLIARGFHRRVKVNFLPDLGDLAPHQFEVQHIGGRHYIGFAAKARVTWVKRATDLILGSFGLVAIAPLLLAVALAIKLDSPGPVFYRQVRVGKDGRRFQIFKFRSMHRDADRRLEELRFHNEATGPLFKMRDDPRVTRVGRVLRRLSLDELPQLFNVLRGEMSLVGPRPPVPSEVAQYEDWQLGRLRAVPGMTGLWQVSGRSEVPFHDMVRLDLHYIRNWSFALDVELLLRTIPAVISHRGAY